MTTLVNLSARVWSPSINDFAFSLSGGETRIRITLTRASWPAGLVAKAGVSWANGSSSFAWAYGGPDGPLVCEVGVPAGVTSGTARVEVVQTATSPVLMESI